jgi:hypothetical protein
MLLDLEALERLLGHGANALGTAIEPLLRVAIAEAEFGGDDDLTAHRRQRFADQFFIGPVGLGRIEQGHARSTAARISLMAALRSSAGP